jgi:hypothetical protein
MGTLLGPPERPNLSDYALAFKGLVLGVFVCIYFPLPFLT